VAVFNPPVATEKAVMADIQFAAVALHQHVSTLETPAWIAAGVTLAGLRVIESHSNLLTRYADAEVAAYRSAVVRRIQSCGHCGF
jgi:hypothetical protein